MTGLLSKNITYRSLIAAFLPSALIVSSGCHHAPCHGSLPGADVAHHQRADPEDVAVRLAIERAASEGHVRGDNLEALGSIANDCSSVDNLEAVQPRSRYPLQNLRSCLVDEGDAEDRCPCSYGSSSDIRSHDRDCVGGMARVYGRPPPDARALEGHAIYIEIGGRDQFWYYVFRYRGSDTPSLFREGLLTH